MNASAANWRSSKTAPACHTRDSSRAAGLDLPAQPLHRTGAGVAVHDLGGFRPGARRAHSAEPRCSGLLSLPNCAPEVFIHARRHIVRICNVFAYRLRVLEAVTANAAKPLVAGEDVRTPLGTFRVVLRIVHSSNLQA